MKVIEIRSLATEAPGTLAGTVKASTVIELEALKFVRFVLLRFES